MPYDIGERRLRCDRDHDSQSANDSHGLSSSILADKAAQPSIDGRRCSARTGREQSNAASYCRNESGGYCLSEQGDILTYRCCSCLVPVIPTKKIRCPRCCGRAKRLTGNVITTARRCGWR